MFSTGQMLFAGLFAVVFITIIAISYLKDKKMHAKNYTGVKWVTVTFVIFLIILFCIKFMFKY